MRIFTVIFLYLFISTAAFADISSYIKSIDDCCENESYKTFSQIIKGSASISDIEKQFVIDSEIEKELNSNFIYTDLEECVKIASDDNFDIKLSTQRKIESYWLRKNAQFSLLPDIIYNYDIQNLEGRYLVGGIVSTTTHEVPVQSIFVLQWSTLNQGRYFFEIAQARNMFKSMSYELEFTKDETLLNTVNAYYDVLEQKMAVEVQKLNLYNRLEQLKYTKGRFDAGIGTLYDVKRAQAELAGAKQEYTETINSLRLRQAELARIIGVDVSDAVYPFEIKVDHRQLVNPDYDVEMLYDQAMESREDVKAKRAEIEAYKAKRSANYTEIMPAVNLTYQNGLVGTKRAGLADHNSLTLDVSISLGRNLLMGTVTQIKADTAVVRQKEIELIQLKRKIKEDILNSYYTSLTLSDRIESAKVEVEAADVSLDLSLKNMKAGEATFIDVIESQNIKVKANLNLIRNMIEYNKAQTKLLFDIGIISPKNVLKDYEPKFY